MKKSQAEDVVLIEKLIAGNMRTTGSSSEVVEAILEDPESLSDLMDALEMDHPGLRMRASDALEKVSVTHPDWLQSYKAELLRFAKKIDQKEVQWHMALVLPRLKLTLPEADDVELIFNGYLLSSASRIVQACAIDGLAQLAVMFPDRIDRVQDRITSAMEVGSPAVVARGRRMLRLLATA